MVSGYYDGLIGRRIRALSIGAKINDHHRRTSQGGWGTAAPMTRAKPSFFRAKATFSGRSHQPKMNKNKYFLYLLNKKRNHSVWRDKVPEIRDFD